MAPPADRTTLTVGQRVDLLVRFGSQTRVQCCRCTRYIRMDGVRGTCLRCGTTFVRQPDDTFLVESLS